jgi:hypothetical protein
MAMASIAELVRQERAAGATDQQISALLRTSGVAPPEGFYVWSAVAIREAVMGEDAGGAPLHPSTHRREEP